MVRDGPGGAVEVKRPSASGTSFPTAVIAAVGCANRCWTTRTASATGDPLGVTSRPVITARLPNPTFRTVKRLLTYADSLEPSPPLVPFSAPRSTVLLVALVLVVVLLVFVVVPPVLPTGVGWPPGAKLGSAPTFVVAAGQPSLAVAAVDGHLSSASGSPSWSASACTIALGCEHCVVVPPVLVPVTQKTSLWPTSELVVG